MMSQQQLLWYVIAIVFVVAEVVVVRADLTKGPVYAGDCVCATTRVNARAKAGLSGTVVFTLSTGQCLTFVGKVISANDYMWYNVDYHGQVLWVAGKYLSKSQSSACAFSNSGEGNTGSCSFEQQVLACTVLKYHDAGVVRLATSHPSKKTDNAYAYNNIRDMCEGRMAEKSSYACKECPTGAPGGYVCLTKNLLTYLSLLASKGNVIVNELAGACHSCRSRHYTGQAVDLHKDSRYQDYIDSCKAMGGYGILEANHVHCQFYD